jgi:Mor family transcriptional regulator
MAENWLKEIAAEIPLDSLPEEYQIIAELFGMEGALKLAQHSGSMRIYVPKLDTLVREHRDARIRAEFTGFNHRDLARKYNLSESWIREIVQHRSSDDQTDMFAE